MLQRACALLTALALAPVAHAGDPPPDILLVVWDATRPDHLSPYGYARPTTPNLDRIASKGTVFEHAYAGAPWTMPSVASLFTGLFSHNHKVDFEAEGFSLSLDDDLTTMAEMLSGAGYATGLFTAQGIYTKEAGFLQGFDTHARVLEPEIGDRALRFLDQAGDRPAFIVLYYLDPHAPYEPKPAHDLWSDKSFEPVNIRGCPKEVDPSKFPPGSVGHCEVNAGSKTLSPAQWQHLQDLYDGELHQNDAFLGQVLDGLEKRGTLDRTAILFTSDHGEAFDDHPSERSWHRLPYDHILHVPLVAYLPGTFPAKKVSTQVRTVDVFPTVAEVAGAKDAPTVNGESLVGLAKKGKGPDRPAVGTSHFVGAPAYYRTPDLKLIRFRKPESAEVYDLKADPQERNDLSATKGDAAVKTWMDFLEATTLSVNGDDEAASQEELERLRALGYVD